MLLLCQQQQQTSLMTMMSAGAPAPSTAASAPVRLSTRGRQRDLTLPYDRDRENSRRHRDRRAARLLELEAENVQLKDRVKTLEERVAACDICRGAELGQHGVPSPSRQHETGAPSTHLLPVHSRDARPAMTAEMSFSCRTAEWAGQAGPTAQAHSASSNASSSIYRICDPPSVSSPSDSSCDNWFDFGPAAASSEEQARRAEKVTPALSS